MMCLIRTSLLTGISSKGVLPTKYFMLDISSFINGYSRQALRSTPRKTSGSLGLYWLKLIWYCLRSFLVNKLSGTKRNRPEVSDAFLFMWSSSRLFCLSKRTLLSYLRKLLRGIERLFASFLWFAFLTTTSSSSSALSLDTSVAAKVLFYTVLDLLTFLPFYSWDNLSNNGVLANLLVDFSWRFGSVMKLRASFELGPCKPLILSSSLWTILRNSTCSDGAAHALCNIPVFTSIRRVFLLLVRVVVL